MMHHLPITTLKGTNFSIGDLFSLSKTLHAGPKYVVAYLTQPSSSRVEDFLKVTLLLVSFDLLDHNAQRHFQLKK